MQVDDCFLVGSIIKLHGFKGELSIKLDTDVPEQYHSLESVFVEIHQKLVPFFISTLRTTPKAEILRVRFEGIDSEEQAETLVRKRLFLPLNQLPPLSGNQFYYHEVRGYTARDTELGVIGTIRDVLEGSAQDVLQIENEQGHEILVPVVDAFIERVDREAKELVLDTPEGLVDFYRTL